MDKVVAFLSAHKALIAALAYAVALAASGHVQVALAVALGALSGGIKSPVPLPLQ